MHKNDFFSLYIFPYHSFSLSYLELQIIFPCRDIGPATATLDPRPRHWTRDRDFGPATRDFGPATRDPRLLVKLLKKAFTRNISRLETVHLLLKTILESFKLHFFFLTSNTCEMNISLYEHKSGQMLYTWFPVLAIFYSEWRAFISSSAF